MRKLNAVVATEAVLAMGVMIYSAVRGAVPVFGGITIHWPVWLFVSGIGLGLLVSFNWPWMRRLSPASRFYDLTPEIKAAHASFMEGDTASWDGGGADLTGKTRAEILVITHKLGLLDVPCPPMNVDVLRTWFPVIQSMAETKRIAAARAITIPKGSAHRVDAGPVKWSFAVSEPTVTHTRAPWHVRIKNWFKKLC